MAELKKLKVRLICRTMPTIPFEEGALDVGMQDKAQTVHVGQKQIDGSMFFECDLKARLDDSAGRLDFRGPFVHGAPNARFLYLSGKRKDVSSSPWYWRVKVPLSGITWKDVSLAKPGEALEADITDRRPHATDLVTWRQSGTDAV